MRFTMYVLSLYVLLTHSFAWADTYPPKVVLGPFAGDLAPKENMDFRNRRLWGCEFVGQNLRNAIFDDCDLGNVILRQCDLRGATFRRSILEGLTIDGCTWGSNSFSDAVIDGIIRVDADDLAGLTFDSLQTTWSFKNKKLSKCIIPSNSGRPVDLSGFSINDVTFVRGSKFDFTNSYLLKSEFLDCDLADCVFNKSRIEQCTFTVCKVDFAKIKRQVSHVSELQLKGVNLASNVDFSNAVLGRQTLTRQGGGRIVFDRATLAGTYTNALDAESLVRTASFKVGDLSECTFDSCDFSNLDLSRQNLVRTRFVRCDLTNCKFDDAVVTGASFEQCTGLTAEWLNTTWNYKMGRPH